VKGPVSVRIWPRVADLEEFGEQWAKAPKNHFVVLIKPKNLPRLEHQVAHSAKVLLEDRGLLLVSN
jgi:hypothetical protein